MLKNIIKLRKRLTNDSTTSYGFKGDIKNVTTDDFDLLRNIGKDYIRESFYIHNYNDIDYENIIQGSNISISIDFIGKFHFYEDFNEFVKSNYISCDVDEFYIYDIDYLEGASVDGLINKRILNYKKNIHLIELLISISDYHKKYAGGLELFFYKSEYGCVVNIDYECYDLDRIDFDDKLSELEDHFCERFDSNERKQIFLNELINILKKDGESYKVILNQWNNIVDNYEKSFSLYLSGYSFEKIKTASTEYFNELTDKIYSTISKFSGYIFAIPASYLLLLRFMDFDGQSLLKDTLLLIIGFLFFCLIWFVLLRNIDEAIASVEKDINSFKEKIENNIQLVDISKELDVQSREIIPKQKNKLMIVRLISFLIFLIILIAYGIVYYNYLFDEVLVSYVDEYLFL